MFITVEGGEGAGKSTLIAALAGALQERGYSPVVTREPGGVALGETVRSWLLNPEITIGRRAELLLFLAARAEHIEEVIQPALKEGRIVLCDRFNDSTVAYQGGGREFGIESVQALCALVCNEIVPNVTLYLDIPPELGLKRISQSHTFDRLESEELAFHKRVRAAFQLLAKKHKERIVTLDATAPADVLCSQALAQILPLCEKGGR